METEVKLDGQVFQRAADEIREHGWWKTGFHEDVDGAVCIGLALFHQRPNCAFEYDAALADKLGIRQDHIGRTSTAIYEINDAQPEETGQEWAIGILEELAREHSEG